MKTCSMTIETKKSLTEEVFLSLLNKWSGKCLSVIRDEKRKMIAVRCEKRDVHGKIRRWEYVLNLQNHRLSVCLDNHSVSGFFKYLTEHDYFENDCGIPVSFHPIVIDAENAEHICTLLNRSSVCSFPLIYLPRTAFGCLPIQADQLAERLKGAAHVFVPKDGKIQKSVKEACPDLLDKSHYIPIIFPGLEKTSYISFHTGIGNKEGVMNQIVRSILTYMNIISADKLDTYRAVRNTLFEERILASEKASREAIAEAEQIVSSYEEDIDLLKESVYEKDMTIQRLEAENVRLKRHLDSGRIPVLYLGQEKEFYSGEIQDLILSVLEDALQDMPDKTRKKDVIADILNSNEYKRISKERNELIKQLLKSYDGMNGKLRKSLEKLGFQIEEGSKHAKITYYGDSRYLAVFGNTPSDFRSGKNNAATIIRMAY